MLTSYAASTTTVHRCTYCAFQTHKFELSLRRYRLAARQTLLQRATSLRSVQHRLWSVQATGDSKDSKYSKRRSAILRDSDARDGYRASRSVKGDWDTRINSQRNGDRPRNKTFEKDAIMGFERMLSATVRGVRDQLEGTPIVKSLAAEQAQTPGAFFKREWARFLRDLGQPDKSRSSSLGQDHVNQPLLRNLRNTFNTGGSKMLRPQVVYAFHDHLLASRFSPANVAKQKDIANMSFPTEWYPATRMMQREFHLHVGPTNSGKTYQALKRLEQANIGAYAGPLRLLAYEVFSRMNAKGIPTILMTGDDKRVPTDMTVDDMATNGWRLSSATVEMLPLNTTMDVCVIDEIQMIGDLERGWSWTQAVLGVKAKEVHLCGEERAIPLVQKLCAATGEKLHIHHYERLSPLKVAEDSLNGDMNKLRKGDCIVSFSVLGIHALRKQIEEKTKRKVAIVYGSLPPETRAQQARLFNEPDNDYDYLVASDAIGMGLNLAIKRVIFETTWKYDGFKHRPLELAHLKQIAGRAGRYRTAAQASMSGNDSGAPPESVGLVTSLEAIDYPIVKAAMDRTPPPLATAGVAPPITIVERFANYFPPETPFSYIIRKLYELCTTARHYHLSDLKDQTYMADVIDDIPGLTIADKYTICQAPQFKDTENSFEPLLREYARVIAQQTGGNLLEISELNLELLDQVPEKSTRAYLRQIESLHKALVLYLWLSYRFHGVFGSRALAFHAKELVEEQIEKALKELSYADRETVVRNRRGRERVEQLAAEAVREYRDDQQDPMDTVREAAVIENGTELYHQPNEPSISDTSQMVESSVVDGLRGTVLDTAEPTAPDVTNADGTADEEQTSSFAQWRARQTSGESQGSTEIEADDTYAARVQHEHERHDGSEQVSPAG